MSVNHNIVRCPGISDAWKSRMLFRVGVDLHTYLHRMLVMSGEDVVRWNTNCANNTQYDRHEKQTQYGLLYRAHGSAIHVPVSWQSDPLGFRTPSPRKPRKSLDATEVEKTQGKTSQHFTAQFMSAGYSSFIDPFWAVQFAICRETEES
jgi:hypothetical protein